MDELEKACLQAMKWMVLGAAILAVALFVKDRAHAAPTMPAPAVSISTS